MTRMAQLILPGLFDLPLEELEPEFVDNELPHLNRILRLATPCENREYSIDAILRSALSLQSTDAGLPLAQAFADDSDTPGRSMLVEAIHLQAGMHNAIAIPIPGNEETSQDISIIINDLDDLFKVDFDISAVSQSIYLLQLKAFDPPTHYPHPLSVLGKSINPFIEQSRQVLPWYRLLNEIQMFMHQHPVNEQRLRQGKLPINSLWAWGAGVPPDSSLDCALEGATRPDWYCDDPVLNRFAGSLGLTVEPCASLALSNDLDHALIVDLRLLHFLKAGLASRLDQLLLDVEQTLVAPVVKTLARRSLPLRLRAGYRVDFELNPAGRFKFWRRPASLANWRN
jgi:hypothetical protein